MTVAVFQLTYTSLFGFHCSYLFLRTGSVIPPILSHVFCNLMGFPDIAGPMAHFPRQRYRQSIIFVLYRLCALIESSSVIVLLYIAGIIGYIYTITRWTKVADSFFLALTRKTSKVATVFQLVA